MPTSSFTTSSYDPVVYDRLRREQPRLHPNHIDLVRLAHHHGLHDLAELDGELEVLAARRRQVCSRLASYRERLWAGAAARAHRRPLRPPEAPMPPAPVDAQRLGGSALRRVAVAVLRRHGPLPLRELHGLLHRYGFEISSERPVQRLADALAYEVRNGRLQRIDRGVYGVTNAVASDPSVVRDISLGEPLPWGPPSAETWDDPGPIDVEVADDPERWSDRRWPAAAQLGSTMCAGPPDRDIADLAADLDVTVVAARERLSGLIATRLGPPPHPLAGHQYAPDVVTDDEMDGDDIRADETEPPTSEHPDRPDQAAAPGAPLQELRSDSSTIRSEDDEWEEGGEGGPPADAEDVDELDDDR